MSSEPKKEVEKVTREVAAQEFVDYIWSRFDCDGSGSLNKKETKKFLQEVGVGDGLSQEAFDEIFNTLDKDNSGTLEKKEMVLFI